MLRPVLQYPDPRLAATSEPVTEINQEIKDLAQDLIDTVKTVGGVGMAAPQIGVLKRVVVVDVTQANPEHEGPQEFVPLINPVISIIDPAKSTENEGCLSVPDFRAKVARPSCVAIDATGLDGKPVHLEGRGYFGACLQHETDHLNGKLFIDYLSYLKRSMYNKKIMNAMKK